MRTFAVVVVKELRQRLRDRSALVVSLIGPVLLATVLSLALAGGGPSVHVRIAFSPQNGGAAADAVRQALVRTTRDRGVETRVTDTRAAAEAAAHDGTVGAAIVFPAGFDAALLRGDAVHLQVIAGKDGALATRIARVIAGGVAARLEDGRRAVRAALAADGRALDAAHVQDLSNRVLAEPLPVQLATTSSGKSTPAAYFGPSMAILFLLFAVPVAARSIVAEHETGTMVRLQAAPIGRVPVLLAKIAASVIPPMAGAAVVWAVTGFGFSANWHDPAAVVLLLLAVTVAAVGISLLVVGLVRTDRQAQTISSLVVFTLALIGGNFIQLPALPDVLRTLARLTPNGWALDGFGRLAGGANAAAVIGDAAVVAGFGLVAAAAGMLLSGATWRTGRA